MGRRNLYLIEKGKIRNLGEVRSQDPGRVPPVDGFESQYFIASNRTNALDASRLYDMGEIAADNHQTDFGVIVAVENRKDK